MANFNGKFESAYQDWETPKELFDRLNSVYSFTLDVAANWLNTKCPKFIGENSLDIEWSGMCWLNPPYGGAGTNKLSKWVEKAYREGQKPDCTVVMLIPARTNTVWWHTYCMRASKVYFIKGRPKFGDSKHGLPQPLAIIVFSARSNKPSMESF